MASVIKINENGAETLIINFRDKEYKQTPNVTTKAIEFEDSIEYELQRDIDRGTGIFGELSETETDEIKYWFNVIEYGNDDDINEALEVLNEYENL